MSAPLPLTPWLSTVPCLTVCFVFSQGTWVRSIKDRFKNQRRTMGDNPQVIEHQVRYREARNRLYEEDLHDFDSQTSGEGLYQHFAKMDDGQPVYKMLKLDPDDSEPEDLKFLLEHSPHDALQAQRHDSEADAASPRLDNSSCSGSGSGSGPHHNMMAGGSTT